MSTITHEAFVHAADGDDKTICGVALDDSVPTWRRLRRLYTTNPNFEDHWLQCAGHECPDCAASLKDRRDDIEPTDVAKRAAADPVWHALYAMTIATEDIRDADDLGRIFRIADQRLATPWSSMLAWLGLLQPVAMRVTAEVIKRERKRLATELAKEAVKMTGEDANKPEVEREAARAGFVRATAIALGGEFKS